MSTILDALRKIEEERQGQDGEVRARILTRSSRRLATAAPRRPLLWTAGVSCILVGVVAGVWIARQQRALPPEEQQSDAHLSIVAATTTDSMPPLVSDHTGPSGKTASLAGEQEEQVGQIDKEAITPLATSERSFARSESPPARQDSPFVSSTQIALRRPPRRGYSSSVA